MAEMEEVPTPTNVEDAATARPESVSSSEDGSSTPPSARKTRSSGPLSISNKVFESINTTRRSARRDNFLKSNESDVSRPRIGTDFQADIPELQTKQQQDEKPSLNKNIKMWTPIEWDPNFDRFCEIARVCRKVSIDLGLKHLLDREYDLKQALVDFELLPIFESIQWSESDFKLLVKKMVQNRRLNVIQKHFIELGKKSGEVVEKRYELFHQLCYGPSNWLCPAMRNCSIEVPVAYRQDCENCSTNLYEIQKGEIEGERLLCNACQLYFEITNKLRPFSTPISQDELIKKGLYKVEEYESEEEHYECFTQPILEERLKPIEWTIKEEERCVQGFRKHGLSFDSIAEELGTKTESQVEKFYLVNRHRYSIDTIVASSEKEKTPPPPSRPRRVQEEDRTPTPTVEDVSAEAKKSDEPSTSNINNRKSAVVEAMA